MTDARMPERWLHDRRLQRLPDCHFKAFVNALMYAVSNRSDGVIEPGDVGLIPGFSESAIKAFVDAGLWAYRPPSGWVIVDYQSTQTSRSVLESAERNRESERLKKQRQRARKAAEARKAVGVADNCDSAVPGDSPRDDTRDLGDERPPDVSRGTPQDRKGQARTGKVVTKSPQPTDENDLEQTGSTDPGTGINADSSPLRLCLKCRRAPARRDGGLCDFCKAAVLAEAGAKQSASAPLAVDDSLCVDCERRPASGSGDYPSHCRPCRATKLAKGTA